MTSNPTTQQTFPQQTWDGLVNTGISITRVWYDKTGHLQREFIHPNDCLKDADDYAQDAENAQRRQDARDGFED